MKLDPVSESVSPGEGIRTILSSVLSLAKGVCTLPLAVIPHRDRCYRMNTECRNHHTYSDEIGAPKCDAVIKHGLQDATAVSGTRIPQSGYDIGPKMRYSNHETITRGHITGLLERRMKGVKEGGEQKQGPQALLLTDSCVWVSRLCTSNLELTFFFFHTISLLGAARERAELGESFPGITRLYSDAVEAQEKGGIGW